MNLQTRALSRRTLLGTTAGALFTGQTSSAQPREKRVFALIGDRYHNPDYIRVALNKVFGPLNLKVDYSIDYTSLSRDSLKNYQLLLILRDGMIWPDGYLGPDAYTSYEQGLENSNEFPSAKPQTWMTEEQGAAIQEFVRAGNGFYALHNSSHISLGSKNYRDVMGGAYIGHPPLRPFKVSITNHAHPITEGIQDFIVNDEQHFVAYDKDSKYVLAESENIDRLEYEKYGSKSPAAWAYDYGKGRVVFTAVGHTIHALWVPQHVELQKRAVRWLLKDL